MVFCTEEYLCRTVCSSRAELIDTTISDMSYSSSFGMEFQDGHRGAHLLHVVWTIFSNKSLESFVNSLTNHIVIKASFNGSGTQD